MEIKTLATVALMMISGLLFGRLCKYIKLPNVTGYLIAGLVFGPSLFNIVDQNMIDEFAIISDIALSFIAFSVGCDFSLDYFKKVGSAPIIVAIFEAMGAVILLTVTLIICKVDLKLSILLGAIAAATAPAQTIMVINQYKAKGPLTSLLLSVVALDDAVALIGFGFASTIVTAMNGKGDRSLVLSILDPFYQVLISAVIGFVLALVMKVLLKWFKKHSNRICVILGMVALTYYLATLLKGSSLLACMCLGAVLTNIIHDSDDVVKEPGPFETANTPTAPISVLVLSSIFFTIGIRVSLCVSLTFVNSSPISTPLSESATLQEAAELSTERIFIFNTIYSNNTIIIGTAFFHIYPHSILRQCVFNIFTPLNTQNRAHIYIVKKAGRIKIVPALNTVHIKMTKLIMLTVNIYNCKCRA